MEEFYQNIQLQLKQKNTCKLTWLHRMLSRCNTEEDFEKALDLFKVFQDKAILTDSETGTLLIKAACRANVPERIIELMKDVDRIRLWPTIGGIHYLMINFALKKNPEAVFEAYKAAQDRKLEANARTYHILIRECIDLGRVEEALGFAKECEAAAIVPHRVTFNILMNGCRKFNKPEQILELRQLMKNHDIGTNYTTCKFTAIAYMMLKQDDKAVDAFMEYPEISSNRAEYFQKVLEVDDENQKKLVLDLFRVLQKKGVEIPEEVAKLL